MSHAYTNLLYHIVFAVKDRMPLIEDARRAQLHAYIGGIIENERGKALAIGGTADHVHLLAKFPPSRLVSDMVRSIKANSSRWARQTLSSGKRFGWQGGYGAFSVSESQVLRVAEYIRNQQQHHKKVGFDQEFIALLEANRIEYDAGNLWD